MPDGEFEPITRAALEASVPACFERQVQRHPTRVALATTGETVTYAELNRLANTVARRILPGAVPSRRPVATLLDPGTAGIAAFLGVLKTGSPVVPLDCNWSTDRLAWILEHSHAEAIVTSPIRAGLAATLVQAGQRVIVLPGAADTPDVPNPDGTIRPDDLAVILYTSGSTGRPKGVLDSHRNLLHETLRLTRSLRLTADDRQTLVRANCAGAISDTCTALLNGAALLPYDPLTAGLGGVASWMARQRPTIWRSTPSLFRAVFGALPAGETVASPRVIFICGEPATGADLELFRDHCGQGCQLVNCFGTTESATVTLQFFDHRTPPQPGILPAGYTVDDMEVVLEDDVGQLFTGPGEGEIVVRSRYLAHGYAGDPDLTARAFQCDPNESGVRLYRTGDLGLRRDDGKLMVLGRRSWQVSIGDQTIEFAGVEAALRALPEIDEAVVTACVDGRGQDRLVAYVVANAALAPPAETLRARLRQVLPAPVSVHLEILDALPRTASGKLDRAALPPLTRTRPLLATPFQAPASDLEVEVARIFGQTLELDEIGLNDSFAELGGKSLGAMRVLTQLSDRYGLRLGLAEFFGAPTVAEIANLAVLHLTYCVSPGLLDEMVTEAERFSGEEAGAILEKKIL